jgi:hypothetical protein
LTLETGQFGEFKVLRKHGNKLLGLVYQEAASVGLPGNNVIHSLSGSGDQHFVKLEWEGRSDTSASRMFFLVIRAVIISMVVIVVLNSNVAMSLLSSSRARGGRLWFHGRLITKRRSDELRFHIHFLTQQVGWSAANSIAGDIGNAHGEFLKVAVAAKLLSISWQGWVADDSNGEFMRKERHLRICNTEMARQVRIVPRPFLLRTVPYLLFFESPI